MSKVRKGNNKGKVKCFLCGKKVIREKFTSLPKQKKKKGTFQSLLVESCLVVDSTISW